MAGRGAALDAKEVQEDFAKGGVYAAGMSVEEFVAFARSETER